VKPVLFVTGTVPAYRAGALARLHELESIEVALFGGSLRHGGPAPELPFAFPSRPAGAAQLARLAAAGRYRAVICPTGGRAALLATWAGARAGRAPLILWASLWAHPRSPAHALSYLPLRRLYHSADAVVTYGPHVSDYVRARGARNVRVAPQSVDNDFWSTPEPDPPDVAGWRPGEGPRYLFVGRPEPEKGLDVLLAAWSAAGLPDANLAIAGGARGEPAPRGANAGAASAAPAYLGALDPGTLRRAYAHSDVLVVPSVATATFREPWALVVNEAMNQGLAVIASDAVGATAGGLVRDGETGLVVPAGDPVPLAAAISSLARDPELRRRLGAAGRAEIVRYTHEAWAQGFSQALATVGLSRGHW
jgi:glycosyltransferase involved in cell wall biosynthesis